MNFEEQHRVDRERLAQLIVGELSDEAQLIREFHKMKAQEAGRGSGRLTHRSASMFAPAAAEVVPFQLTTRSQSRLATLPGPADQTVIRAIPIPYGMLSLPMVDGTSELYQEGCFGDLRSAIAMLADHDFGKVLGKVSSGTCRFFDSPSGVTCECTPPPTTWASDLLISMSRLDITGSSAGFYLDKFRTESRNGQKVRIITSARLIEASIVSYPAYPDAGATVEDDKFLSDLGIESL